MSTRKPHKFTWIEENKLYFKIAWNLLIVLSVCLSVVEAPFHYVMDIKVKESHLWWDGLISVLFFFDIYLSWTNKAQIREDEVTVPLNSFRVDAVPYKKSLQLYLDIIASIPFDIIGAMLGAHSMVKGLRLLRLMRILRIAKLFKMYDLRTLLPNWINLLVTAISMYLCLHLIACGWMLIYPPELGVDAITFYNKAVYWALTTLTTIGYGDITPSTNVGRVYTMFIMVTGVIFYGIVIGNVSRLILIADRHKEANKEKMNDLHMFMKHYMIPPSLQRQVFSFYQHILEKRLSDNDSKIISELPPALQNELQLYMKLKLIQNVPIFKGSKLMCLKLIASNLKQSVFTPGEKIIEKGEMGNEMFIIGHGEVEVVIENSVVATLSDGYYFGEIALLEETVRTADVRSKAYCDLYTLDKESFLEITSKFPELDEKFRQMYSEKLKKVS